MSNATKTLTALFAILLVLTGLTAWLSGPAESEAFRAASLAVDTSRVDRLVVNQRDGLVALARTDAGWQVETGDASYPADEAAITRALETLTALRVRGVPTRQPEQHVRYGVDSTAVTLEAQTTGGDVLLALALGRTQFGAMPQQGQGGMFTQNQMPDMSTYIRRLDEDAVYAVDGLLTPTFERDAEGWRDRQVWSLDQNALTRIDLRLADGSAHTLDATPDGAWLAGTDTLDAAAMSRLLSRVADLTATTFVNDATPEGFRGEAGVQLALTDGVTRTLELRTAADDSTRYEATADGYPYVFTLNRSLWDSNVLVAPEALQP